MEEYLAAKQRPVGVTILSILFLIGAVLLTGITAFAVFAVASGDDRVRQISESLATFGMPISLLAFGVALLVALSWASGIGMLLGTKWGWYCGSFWYAYAIMRNLNALWFLYGMPETLTTEMSSSSSRGPEHYYIKYSGRLIVSCLIYLYFFKANVREHFGLSSASGWKAVFLEFGLCVGMLTVGTALAHALG
jgi:hypothetical protein